MLIEAVNLHIILQSLPAWGVRVEINWLAYEFSALVCHSPHGECGLKFVKLIGNLHGLTSLPAWGVRVEICTIYAASIMCMSLPAWGVRVEICPVTHLPSSPAVTPRMGSAG